MCDELAMENMDPRVPLRYPQGWELVSCRRHTPILQKLPMKPQKSTWHSATLTANSSAWSKKPQKSELSHQPLKPQHRHQHQNPALQYQPPTQEDEREPCPICTEGTPNLTVDCGHSFCSPCLTQWQQGCTDQKFADWLRDRPMLRARYPVLEAILKSRFTCPMCRNYLQHTKLSRRAKKMWNRRERGEPAGVSSRSRRGGQR
ncbi:unnamed protein product, partial [Aureobasidium vineae]